MNILAMFYLTNDRLFKIIFSFRYARFWNVKKTWRLCIITSVLNIIFGVVAAWLRYAEPSYVKMIPSYVINATLCSIYLVFSTLTYIVIFKKYVRSKRTIQRSSGRRDQRQYQLSAWKIFAKSQFFISVLLIGSFLMFAVIPRLMRTIWYYHFKKHLTYDAIKQFYMISSRISFTVDGVIYIFLQKPIRNLLCRKLRRVFCNNGNQIRSGSSTNEGNGAVFNLRSVSR